MKVDRNNTAYNLPDCLIVGAAKSGSTALFQILSQYDDVSASSIKEPWFFSFMDEGLESKYDELYITNFKKYTSLFKNSDEKISLEASVTYLYLASKSIENIKSVYGEKYKDVKIVIILRNPIDRAWSQYQMINRDQNNHLSLEEIVEKNLNNELIYKYPTEKIGHDLIGFGMYSNSVNKFIDNFNNVKIIIYDDFINNYTQTIKSLKEFLNIESDFIPRNINYNASGKPKNLISKMMADFIYKKNIVKSMVKFLVPSKIRYNIRISMGKYLFKKEPISLKKFNLLKDIYSEDIQSLSKLINKDLSFWLEYKK